MFRLIVKLSAPLSIVLGVLIGLTTLYGESLPSWQVMYASQLSNGFWSVNEMDVNRRLNSQLFSENLIYPPPILASPNQRYVAISGSSPGTHFFDRQTRDEYSLEGSPVSRQAFSPDSRYLVMYLDNHYQVIELFEDGGMRVPSDVNPALLRASDRFFAWSPQSDRFAFSQFSRLNNRIDIDLYDMRTQDSQNLTSELTTTSNHPLAWSPDGETLAYLGIERNAHIYTINVNSLNHQQITNTPLINTNLIISTWSPDGQYLAMGILGSGLNILSLTHNETMQIIDHNWEGHQMVWSKDSERLVFVSHQNGDLFTVNVDGTSLTRLTDNDDFNVLLP